MTSISIFLCTKCVSVIDSAVRQKRFDEWGNGIRVLFMGNSLRSDDLNQALLLPPSLHDWLPEK